ncbi:MerR family transcriptional regulator [Peribacillus saganii]|uniref:MerR family transcriptional regulator n=1 Tax=Peribacillus saganii TaxID=2303992 RepID=UPI00115ECE58|nr:cobalamin B12-binding domain-containing protein [Peribacillus saganii]
MFGIKKVSELTGVPEVTLRSWERRYKVINPSRSQGGARYYTKENIEDIIWIKKQKDERGITVRQAMDLLKEIKEMKVESTITGSSYEEHIEEILNFLTEYQTEQATKQINLCFSMFDFEEVFHHIFTPILHRVGYQWENGKLSVAQEHFICNFLQRRIFPFFHDLYADPMKPKAVALCAPEELHNVGLLLFSLFLKRRGIDVLFLGQSTPTESLLPLIHLNNVQLVCISITMEESISQVETFISDLLSKGTNIDFVIGGAGAKFLSEPMQKYRLKGDLENWKKWLNSRSKL